MVDAIANIVPNLDYITESLVTNSTTAQFKITFYLCGCFVWLFEDLYYTVTHSMECILNIVTIMYMGRNIYTYGRHKQMHL